MTMNMNDITVENGEIICSDEMMEITKQARSLAIRQKKLDIEMERFKEAMKVAMGENGIKKFENEYITVTYTPEHTAERLDSKLLKEKHPKIAKECTKESTVKASVRVTFR